MLARLAPITIFFLTWSVLAFPTLAQTENGPTRSTIRVMSFNIRYGLANDGENDWKNRKNNVVKTITHFGPDIIGTQETLQFQGAFLEKNLPDYTYVGRSREKNPAGEQCGILFRTARFDKLVEGYFWLSESPDVHASKSWDSSLPRMATWLKLRDRINHQSLYIINTHFDHIGSTARLESARLIRRFIDELPAQAHVIITGDFNTPENSAPYQALFSRLKQGPADNIPPRIVDTFRIRHPVPTQHNGTFNRFKGIDTGGRIDWIGATRSFDIKSANIDKTSFGKRFPSDHFPVTAEMSFRDK